MVKLEQTKTYALETFGAEHRRHRTNALPAHGDLENPGQPFNAYELHERGVRGALLYESDPGNLGTNSGYLVGIMHQRCGHPEWVTVTSDFRRGWCSLSDKMQAALLDAERTGADDEIGGVPVSKETARMIPEQSGFAPSWGADAVEAEPYPALDADQAAFLWVLNAYYEDHGQALQLFPEKELRSIPRFTDY